MKPTEHVPAAAISGGYAVQSHPAKNPLIRFAQELSGRIVNCHCNNGRTLALISQWVRPFDEKQNSLQLNSNREARRFSLAQFDFALRDQAAPFGAPIDGLH